MASQTDLLKEFDPLVSPEHSGPTVSPGHPGPTDPGPTVSPGHPAVIPSTLPPSAEESTHPPVGTSCDLTLGAPREEPAPAVQVGVTLPQATICLSAADVGVPEAPPTSCGVPQDSVTVPQEGVIVHQEGVAVPQEGVTLAQGGVALPQEGVTVHQEGVIVHQEGAATATSSALANNLECPVPSPPSTTPASSEKKRRSHKHKRRSLHDKEKAAPIGGLTQKPAIPVAMAPLAPVPDVNLAQTQMEMMQIDSILQALSKGNFDSSSLAAISQLTSQKAAPPTAPPTIAGTSLGLQLINQIQSGEEEESSSSESDSEESTEEEEEEGPAVVDEEDEEEVKGQGRKYGYPTVKGEVDYRDLPQVEKRVIPFPAGAQLAPVGRVSHITEKLVVIEALPGASPVNEGTVVWSHEKDCLGEIFETFGPVKKPFYSLLLNNESPQEISPSLSPGQFIYVVPNDQSLTSYVFTAELMKQKGCDASWKGDIEVPAELQEHSDDEVEVKSRKGGDREDKPRKKDDRKRNDRLQKTSSVVYTSDPSMKAYFQGPQAPPPGAYHHPMGVAPPPGPYGYPMSYPPPPPQGHPQYPPYPPYQSSPGYPGGSYYPLGPYYPPPHGLPPFSAPQSPANYPAPQGSSHYQAPPHGYQGAPRGY